jgi:RNA polymerase sigma-70 factor (ECF subfamily)
MQDMREAAHERALAEAFCAGDNDAFAILFRRYYTRLCRDAERFVTPDRAEDVVQSVFATLAMQRRWSIRTTVRKYLHAAVRNRARDVLAHDQVESEWAESFPDVPVNPSSRPSLTPEDDVVLEELRTLIAHGLDTCSPRERDVLQLAEELPRYAAIGARLGLSAGTVHTLLARGRRRLRRYLAAHGWPEVMRVSAHLTITPPHTPSRHPLDGHMPSETPCDDAGPSRHHEMTMHRHYH